MGTLDSVPNASVGRMQYIPKGVDAIAELYSFIYPVTGCEVCSVSKSSKVGVFFPVRMFVGLDP